MPIVYVHGVANHEETPWKPIEALLRRYIAPAISDDPAGVSILRAKWFDVGARFAWNRAARPRTSIAGQGAAGAADESEVRQLLTAAEHADLLATFPDPPATPTSSSGLAAQGPVATGAGDESRRLESLSEDSLSDLLATVLVAELTDEDTLASALVIADEVARAPATRDALAACADLKEELETLRGLVEDAFGSAQAGGLASQGARDVLARAWDRLSESMSRGASLPGFALSRVLGELRPRVDEFVTHFLGDIFTYLTKREIDGAPGPIPARFLDTLARAAEAQTDRDGEGLVVVSHSMGGQIVYDAVTHFLPYHRRDSGIRIDFWCATASQVGLFEELKLFKASDEALEAPDTVAFPDKRYLGDWWNLWDPNDVLSFSVRSIIEHVIDQPFDSGMSLLGAHGGYLGRPSFYRAFAEQVAGARKIGWSRR